MEFFYAFQTLKMEGSIAIINDIHIELSKNAILDNTQSHFVRILDSIAKENIKNLIINGDLCKDKPSIEIYQWIKETLEQYPFNYYIIAGNHDKTKMIHQCFPYKNALTKDIDFIETLHTNILFLDTSSSQINELHLNFLDYYISNIASPKNKIIYIFMHHPILDFNFEIMEKEYQIRNKSKMISILEKYSSIKFIVFSGHYHIHSHKIQKNIENIVCPPCFFPLEKNSTKVAYNPNGSGWTKLDIKKTGFNFQFIFIPSLA